MSLRKGIFNAAWFAIPMWAGIIWVIAAQGWLPQLLWTLAILMVFSVTGVILAVVWEWIQDE